MSAPITAGMLAAAPTGSIIRRHSGRPMALKIDDFDANPWRNLSSRRRTSAAALATELPDGARLVWPADAPAAPTGQGAIALLLAFAGAYEPASLREVLDDLTIAEAAQIIAAAGTARRAGAVVRDRIAAADRGDIKPAGHGPLAA